LIESAEPADYAAAVAGYLDDRDAAARACLVASEMVERFDASRVTRQWEECYDGLLRRRA
jgi:hypothetical protein